MLLQPANLLGTFCLSLCLLGTANAQTTYNFLHKISLPGDGKWDYLKMDGERERLYVSHTDRVHVIDLTTDKPIAEITGPGRSAGAGVPLG